MPDVLIVGGGLIGLGIAWRTAQAGLSVTVADPEPGSGASWVGAGMLAPITEVIFGEEELLRLNLESIARYPEFVAELENLTGRETGYLENGMLMVAKDADDLAELEHLASYREELGLPVDRLRSRECAEMEPMLGRVRGGVWVESDHQVDTRKLLEALLEACRREDVEILPHRVTELRSDGQTVQGVSFADREPLDVPRVVLAAGAWSARIEGVPRHLIPVRPVKGQLLHLRGPADFLRHNLRITVEGSHTYVVSRGDGRLVVGATVEEMGFDTTVTAGAVYGLLRDAYAVLPGIAELEITETIAGLRPGSPDNAPFLGPAGPEGLVVATGHYRNGILLTPVTADAIGETLVTGQVPELIRTFSPTRFQERVAS